MFVVPGMCIYSAVNLLSMSHDPLPLHHMIHTGSEGVR